MCTGRGAMPTGTGIYSSVLTVISTIPPLRSQQPPSCLFFVKGPRKSARQLVSERHFFSSLIALFAPLAPLGLFAALASIMFGRGDRYPKAKVRERDIALFRLPKT